VASEAAVGVQDLLNRIAARRGERIGRGGDKYAWRGFTYELKPRQSGYLTILARAWDDRGNAQPAVPAWNPLGYFWNGWHRVGVVIET